MIHLTLQKPFLAIYLSVGIFNLFQVSVRLLQDKNEALPLK